MNASEINACTHAFAVPGQGNWIDLADPATGRSKVYNETLEQIRLRYPGAELVEIESWMKNKAAAQDTPVEWVETTEERYEEALDALPPAAYLRGGFLLGEPQDHHATSGLPRFDAYVKRDGKYFVSSRPLTIPEARKL